MEKFAKAVRIATLAPIMAFVLITLCFFLKPGSFDALQYILAIIFLTVLPMLGYPLQPHVPESVGEDLPRRRVVGWYA